MRTVRVADVVGRATFVRTSEKSVDIAGLRGRCTYIYQTFSFLYLAVLAESLRSFRAILDAEESPSESPEGFHFIRLTNCHLTFLCVINSPYVASD